MRILVAAATHGEVKPFVAELRLTADGGPRLTGYIRSGHEIVVLITGVGMVATAAWCSRTLAQSRYDLALNLGVCGSFDRAFPPGTVVHVTADRLPELGVEDGDTFVPADQLAVLRDLELPFTGERPTNLCPPRNEALNRLPEVDGITVNTVHGNERSIAAVVARCKPQVESMEGAAFMYTCMIHQTPFAQIRAVSNMIERRRRDAWRLDEAVLGLGEAALRVIDHA